MSTGTHKMLNPLRPGKSDAGHIVVDDRGRNVWEWKDETVKDAGSTTLLQKLDNNQLGIADTQMWRKEDLQPAKESAGKPRELSLEEGDEPAPTARSHLRPAPLRKKDAGGGFNPYG